MSEAPGRISVSEDKLRLLFAEFKLELVKELSAYATVTSLEKWQDEVRKNFGDLHKRLRVVEDAQTGRVAVSKAMKVGIGAAVTFFSAVIGALLYMVAQGVH